MCDSMFMQHLMDFSTRQVRVERWEPALDKVRNILIVFRWLVILVRFGTLAKKAA